MGLADKRTRVAKWHGECYSAAGVGCFCCSLWRSGLAAAGAGSMQEKWKEACSPSAKSSLNVCARGPLSSETHASIFVLFHPSAFKRQAVPRFPSREIQRCCLFTPKAMVNFLLHPHSMRSDVRTPYSYSILCDVCVYAPVPCMCTKAVELNLHVVYFWKGAFYIIW